MEVIAGDPVIDSKDDDLYEILNDLCYTPDEVYACISWDGPDRYSFNIYEHGTSEEIVTSMDIFETYDQAWAYLNQWIIKEDISREVHK